MVRGVSLSGARTFRQGVHPPEAKERTAQRPIEVMPLPAQLVVPLQQHIGAPTAPVVEVGDDVRRGQRIGHSDAFVSAEVHASASGKVLECRPALHPVGADVLSLVIAADAEADAQVHFAERPVRLEEMEPVAIRQAVQEAGIVGMGGAGFPTHVKVSPPRDTPIDTVIINGCECEPGLTGDHRLMVERAADVLLGLRAVVRAVGAERAFIGIEANKLDAVAEMRRAVVGEPAVGVAVLRTKYPQGGEKVLIKAILNREVPAFGLPMAVGVVVHNVATCVAIAEKLRLDKPLYERVVTVTGTPVARPGNYLVRIGTSFRDLLEFAGCDFSRVRKVIAGGPMMGVAQYSLEVPVVKGTAGIVVQAPAEVDVAREHPCIRCGRCVDTCPVYLEPYALGQLAKAARWTEVDEYHIMNCMECGCCAYICPARIPLVQYIKLAKFKRPREK
jgi:electron transport complex protein RnfC